MARPTAAQVLGTVTLVTGPEEFLAERTVASVVDAVRAGDAEADHTEIGSADLGRGALAELTSPSLFSASRAVVVRDLQDLPDDSADALLAYATAPAPDVAVVLVHSGGQKGRSLLERLRKAKAVTVSCDSPKHWELPRFVVTEVRSAGGRIDEPAAAYLVDAVGSDLRALAGAAAQLVSDFPGEQIGTDVVHSYFGGRAEVKGFAIADAALAGRRDQALEQLRWAMVNGIASVLVTSAFAAGLRGVARLASAPPRMREADLAREVGVPAWKLRSLRSQARGWSDHGLAEAITEVARADGDVKGVGGEAGHALERMVLAVVAARERH
jgi:DNA polymerase III subunit delta